MAERRTERGQPNLCGRPKGPHDTCRNSIPDAAQWCTKCRSKRGGCFLLDGYDTDPGEQAIRSVSPRLDHSSSPRGSTHLQLDYVGHGIRSDGLEIPTIEEGKFRVKTSQDCSRPSLHPWRLPHKRSDCTCPETFSWTTGRCIRSSYSWATPSTTRRA